MAVAASPLLARTEVVHGPASHSEKIGSPSTSGGYALDLITRRAVFDALEPEWNALFERSGRGTQMFQTFNWLWHWCNHYLTGVEGGHRPELAIVTARRDGRLAMVWPLARERTAGVNKLIWMGEPVSQYGDVLIEEGPNALPMLRAAWRFIADRCDADVVQLRKVRADAAVAPLLAEIGARAAEELAAPYLDLRNSSSFADYEKRYSSGTRRNRRRQRRRLEERGPVSVEAHHCGASAKELARAAIHLKRTWIAERALVSRAVADDRFLHFFENVAEAHIRPAGCLVTVLRSDGKPAALEIGVRCKDRTAIHVIVYDDAFEKVAAGSLLMEESIGRAIADGLSTFDLLAPADAYKRDWADAVMDVRDWVAPLSGIGWAYDRIYLGVVREGGKRLLLMLPMSIRRFAADVIYRFNSMR